MRYTFWQILGGIVEIVWYEYHTIFFRNRIRTGRIYYAGYFWYILEGYAVF